MRTFKFVYLLIWVVCSVLASHLNFHIPIGDVQAQLSCVVVVIPLIAYVFSLPCSIFFGASVWFLLHLSHAHPLTFGIPTLMAILSWRASAKHDVGSLIINAFLPLCAIALFVSSDVGECWYYSTYWFIPLICIFFKPTRFVRAVQSTFVQHATGTVMWLYFADLPPVIWGKLLPIVAIERALAVAFSLALISVMTRLTKYISRSKEVSLVLDHQL
jgi:hypothetical protein